MASVKGNILGNLRGKIGNLSARIVSGRTVLAARPSSFKTSQAPLAVLSRSKFAVTVNFINFILSLSNLFDIWDNFRPKNKRLRNTVFKHNYFLCDYEKPTASNIITPGGFLLPVQSAALDEDSLNLELNALNTSAVFTPEEVNITISGLVMFHNPVNENDEPYAIIKLSKDEPGFDFTVPYTGSINLDNVQQSLAAKYQAGIIYLAVSSKTAEGEIVQYSATYSKES